MIETNRKPQASEKKINKSCRAKPFNSNAFERNPQPQRFKSVFFILEALENTDITSEKKIKNLTFDFRYVRKEWIMKMNNIKRIRRYSCLS